MKILILVLTCDTQLYNKLTDTIRKTWGNNTEDKVEIVYYYYNNNIDYSYIKDDNLYLKGEECLYNIGYKTLDAFEFFFKNKEFDYIFRTNVSSYVNINELIKYIEDKPNNNYCSAFIGCVNGVEFPSGSGYFFSKDVVKKIILNREKWNHTVMDDVSLGIMLNYLKIKINLGIRLDITNDEQYINLTKKTYHYRCKHENDREKDIMILKKLYSFYKN